MAGYVLIQVRSRIEAGPREQIFLGGSTTLLFDVEETAEIVAIKPQLHLLDHRSNRTFSDAVFGARVKRRSQLCFIWQQKGRFYFQVCETKKRRIQTSFLY